METEDLYQLILGLKTGLIFLGIVTVLRLYWRKNVLKKIRATFKDEKILHILEPSYVMTYVSIFGLGGFWGNFIFPFLLSDDVQQISVVTRTSLPLFIVTLTILCVIMVLALSVTDVITEKRIYRLSYFSFVNAVIIKLNTKFSEILSVEYYELPFSGPLLTIKTKDQTYNLGGVKNLKEIKRILDDLK